MAVTPSKGNPADPSGQVWLQWTWAQLKLLWPAMQALVAWVIWLDWSCLPRETYQTLKSAHLRSELLRLASSGQLQIFLGPKRRVHA